MRKIARVLVWVPGYAFAVFVGIFPAFLLVFKAIFSDELSVLDHVVMLILVILTYGVLGLVFSFILPSPSWRWAIWLNLMAFLFAGWYSTYKVGRIPLNVLYLTATGVSAYLGSLLGTLLSPKKRRKED